MNTTRFLPTHLTILHHNEHNQVIHRTRLDRFFEHQMPAADFPVVATVHSTTSTETIEFRRYGGLVYREEPGRAREVQGSMIYQRMPHAQATEFIANSQGNSKRNVGTLAYRNKLWVLSELPNYTIRVDEKSVLVEAVWDPKHPGPQFNCLQADDADSEAARIAKQGRLRLVHRHSISLVDATSVGPASATTEAGAVINTVNQRLGLINETVERLRAVSSSREALVLVNKLDILTRTLQVDAHEAASLDHRHMALAS